MPPKGNESSSPSGITSGDGSYLSGLKKTIGVSSDVVGKGVLSFVKKSPSLEATAKVTGSFGGGAVVGVGGVFTAKKVHGGSFPTPPKGKELSSPMDATTGIAADGGNFLSRLKKTIGDSSSGVGKGALPFMKKYPSLEANPAKVVGSFGGGVGSDGVFKEKSVIGGGFQMPPKGKESSSLINAKGGITSDGGIFLSGLKKTIVSCDGTNEKGSFSPLKGVIGDGYPSSLKSPLSHKLDDYISESIDDGSAPLTLNEPIANVSMKTPSMAGPRKTNLFLESLSKEEKFGGQKSEDNGNGVLPSRSTFFESLSKRNLVAMKDTSESGTSFPMKNSFTESFSKGNFGEIKAKSGSLPLPPPLKGMEVSSGANVGTGLPFMRKSIISDKDEAEAASNQRHGRWRLR